ncbi:MAG: hypothetical protein HQM10_01585 [Candidatus Riflebacteria bacterium]|nr:hypothetical protein [Candidatus Riflebacteria bacterium]
MDYLIRQADFRAFSYETDPEYVVDMQRCREVLEGGWLDREETCKVNHKIVLRANGTSWILSVSRAIIAYADMIGDSSGNAWIQMLRIHSDFRYPKTTSRFLKEIQKQAEKRNLARIFIFSDRNETTCDLSQIGLSPERKFRWISTQDVDSLDSLNLSSESISLDISELSDFNMHNFLGPNLNPKFIVARSFMAPSYDLFQHKKPLFIRFKCDFNEFLACFDGREWFVFRAEQRTDDLQAITPILSALNEIKSSVIRISENAIGKIGLVPSSDEVFADYIF